MVEARALASKLSRSTDALNARLAQMEKDVAALRLGVEAWVTISSASSDEHDEYTTQVGFAKHAGEWKLMRRSGFELDEAIRGASPLLQASREERLIAADRLPELLEELVSSGERQLE